MNKWIKFKFKNKLWLYLIILGASLGGLAILAIKNGEAFIGVGLIAILLIASIGAWFGNHYGIRVTDEYYILVCNATIKRIAIKDLTSLIVNFVKGENNYMVYAVAYLTDGRKFDFVWSDVYCIKGGKLKIGITDDNLEELISKLSELEKVHLKVIKGGA